MIPRKPDSVDAIYHGAVGQPITLHSGPIDFGQGITDGEISMRFRPKPEIAWVLHPGNGLRTQRFVRDTARLKFDHFGLMADLQGRPTAGASGTFGRVRLGDDNALLSRAVVHWLNLPAIRLDALSGENADVDQTSLVIDGWRLTVDRMPNYSTLRKTISERGTIAITHLMSIERSDEAQFTAGQLEALLHALHYGASFAIGRWIAPALPVGFDLEGKRRWEEWAPVFCETGMNGSLAWWNEANLNDFETLIEGLLLQMAVDDFGPRLLVASVVQSGQTGFIEQRLMTQFAAIEHISWTTLKVEQGISRGEYDRLHTDGRLTKLLSAARVPVNIDAAELPELARFAASESSATVPLTGPEAVNKIRNGIVHPKGSQDRLYSSSSLLEEAWRLTYDYLCLVILHRLDYRGSFHWISKTNQWHGSTLPVPWL